MKCIQFHSSFSLHSHSKHHKQQPNTYRFVWPCQHEPTPTSTAKFGQRIHFIKTRAAIITNPLILADTSTAKPGDVSVLLQTGGLLLFVYLIANFVVPAFITKYYEFDKETEDSVSENEGFLDDEASKPKSKSQSKKRGFQG